MKLDFRRTGKRAACARPWAEFIAACALVVGCKQPAPSSSGCAETTGATCDAGHCQITLAVCQDPEAIAVSPAGVFWTDHGQPGGRPPGVRTVPLGGGVVTTLASTDFWVGGIAVNSDKVFWTNGHLGTVMSVSIGGGAVTTLASGQSSPDFIAADDTNVYWTNAGTTAQGYYDGAVMMVPVGGGAPVTLAAGLPHPEAIAIDAVNVYWGNALSDLQSVMKIPRAGGVAMVLGPGAGQHFGIAVYGTSVYWTNYDAGTLMKAPIVGGALTTLASAQDRPTGLAVDGENVYWVNGTTLMRMPLGGGPAAPVASGLGGLFPAIALDATSVYYLSGGGAVRDQLWKLTPK